MIAEKEVVHTFLLQLLSERGILDRLAFKGKNRVFSRWILSPFVCYNLPVARQIVIWAQKEPAF